MNQLIRNDILNYIQLCYYIYLLILKAIVMNIFHFVLDLVLFLDQIYY
jgi:hypothetical protein